MSASGKSPLRPLAVGGAAGLIVGCLIGWLAIGWGLWPVQYVGDAYTYELNDTEKMGYVAAVADSYNLTGQVEVARQRFNGWTTEEEVSALAQLFADYQAQGKMQEAQRVTDLAVELQRAEGWDSAGVGQVTNQVAAEYTQQGAGDKAQFVALFAGALGTSGVVTPPASVPVPATTAPQAQIPLVGNVGTLLRLCGVLLLLLVLVLLISVILRRRRSGRKPAAKRAEAEWTGAGPRPLLQKTSSYALGMDNFDESFAIETEDDKWLGECGMGISESLGEGTPRRVTAFEVWLFDKPNTRTVTNVLMSDFAYNDEGLRTRLSSRGDAVLATPNATFTLETPALTIEAQVVEMEYGDGMPAFGYFNNLKVSLTVRLKPGADVSGDMPVPPGM
jgi:hypothetical protein